MHLSIRITTLAVAGLVLVAGCQERREGGEETTTAETTTVRGADTVSVPTTVPTTDTVVRKTTTETDTIKGEARDTVRRDTTKRP